MQIKQALTGYGKADKKQMQAVVASLLKLKTVPKPDDAADALAVALCQAFTSRFGELFAVGNMTRTKGKNAQTGGGIKLIEEAERRRKLRVSENAGVLKRVGTGMGIPPEKSDKDEKK